MLEAFSRLLNCDPHPLPPTRRRMCPLPLVQGGHTLLREGGGGPNWDEGTDSVVVLLVYMYFMIHTILHFLIFLDPDPIRIRNTADNYPIHYNK
jgi:hypothetical protein